MSILTIHSTHAISVYGKPASFQVLLLGEQKYANRNVFFGGKEMSNGAVAASGGWQQGLEAQKVPVSIASL